MKIALFGKNTTDVVIPFIQELVDALYNLNGVILIYQPFFESIRDKIIFRREPLVFNRNLQRPEFYRKITPGLEPGPQD